MRAYILINPAAAPKMTFGEGIGLGDGLPHTSGGIACVRFD